jgi:hypothetical protein
MNNDQKQSVTKEKKRTATEWLKVHARQQTGLCALGAILLLPLAALLHFFTYWAIWMVFLRIGFFWAGGPAISMAAIIALIILHPLYLWTDREELERVELDPLGNRIGAIFVARVTGYGILGAFAGPKTLMTYARMISQILLIAPGVFWTSLRLFRRAWWWHALDVDRVGKMVHCLYTEEGKVPADILLGSDIEDEDRAHSLMQQLLMIDGVLILRQNELGFSLGTDLRRDISRWRKKNKSHS